MVIIATYLVFLYFLFTCYIVEINFFFWGWSLFSLDDFISDIEEDGLRVKHILVILISLLGWLVYVFLVSIIKYGSKIMNIRIGRKKRGE